MSLLGSSGRLLAALLNNGADVLSKAAEGAAVTV
jgi:hypothetical protein